MLAIESIESGEVKGEIRVTGKVQEEEKQNLNLIEDTKFQARKKGWQPLHPFLNSLYNLNSQLKIQAKYKNKIIIVK